MLLVRGLNLPPGAGPGHTNKVEKRRLGSARAYERMISFTKSFGTPQCCRLSPAQSPNDRVDDLRHEPRADIAVILLVVVRLAKV